jgi:predicted transposase YdaD
VAYRNNLERRGRRKGRKEGRKEGKEMRLEKRKHLDKKPVILPFCSP